MPDRLPPVVRSEVGPGAEPVYDKFSERADGMFGDPKTAPFLLKRPSDGALVGPFPFLFAQHEAGEQWMALFSKFSMIPGLSAEAKETAILAVGAKFKAAYELYAHTNVATKKVGMSKDVVEAIASGEKPSGLNEECSVAYDTASHLAATPGPLPQDLWDKCISTFGKQGTVALVHYAGAYAYTCIILNAMDAPVPKDSD